MKKQHLCQLNNLKEVKETTYFQIGTVSVFFSIGITLHSWAYIQIQFRNFFCSDFFYGWMHMYNFDSKLEIFELMAVSFS